MSPPVCEPVSRVCHQDFLERHCLPWGRGGYTSHLSSDRPFANANYPVNTDDCSRQAALSLHFTQGNKNAKKKKTVLTCGVNTTGQSRVADDPDVLTLVL